MENPAQKLFRLKHQLLSALLEKPSKLWTDAEVELGYILSKDEDIQKTLELARRKSENSKLESGKVPYQGT
jgi:hypothetical protein